MVDILKLRGQGWPLDSVQEFPPQVKHDYNHWGENWINTITNDNRNEDEGHTSSSTEPESADKEEHWKWEAQERARDAHRQLEGQQGSTSSTEPKLVEEEDEHRKAWEALQAEIAKWRQKQKHMKEAEHQEEEAHREVEWHQEQIHLQERHQKEMEHQKEEARKESERHQGEAHHIEDKCQTEVAGEHSQEGPTPSCQKVVNCHHNESEGGHRSKEEQQRGENRS